MRVLRFGIVVAVLGLTACATALPPVARITESRRWPAPTRAP
jgi:hypothetical protein